MTGCRGCSRAAAPARRGTAATTAGGPRPSGDTDPDSRRRRAPPRRCAQATKPADAVDTRHTDEGRARTPVTVRRPHDLRDRTLPPGISSVCRRDGVAWTRGSRGSRSPGRTVRHASGTARTERAPRPFRDGLRAVDPRAESLLRSPGSLALRTCPAVDPRVAPAASVRATPSTTPSFHGRPYHSCARSLPDRPHGTAFLSRVETPGGWLGGHSSRPICPILVSAASSRASSTAHRGAPPAPPSWPGRRCPPRRGRPPDRAVRPS